jgi:hypothetical protein
MRGQARQRKQHAAKKHVQKNVKASMARMARENWREVDEDVPTPNSSLLSTRARVHKMRTSGAAQMEAFLDSVAHLPPLPKDIINCVLWPLVCGAEDAVYLVGGIDPDNFDADVNEHGVPSTFRISTRLCRVQGGAITELAPLPSPRCSAGVAHYQGEIIVIGGSRDGSASSWRAPSLLQVWERQPPLLPILVYNIADDEWREEENPFSRFGAAAMGSCSVQVYRDTIFVCGAKGRDVAIDARTMEQLPMPQRGDKCKGTHMQTVLLETGLLVCFGASHSCVEYETGRLVHCCSSLQMLDVCALLDGDAEACWQRLPLPPAARGHLRPDAAFFVRGSCLYLLGGASALDSTCCEQCTLHELSEVHRILDLGQDELVWRFENEDSGGVCSGTRVVPMNSGQQLVVGGMDGRGALVPEISLDDRVLPEATYRGALFGTVKVPVLP